MRLEQVFKIVKKRELNPTVTEMVIEAPLIAKKAKAGQFIIIRAKEDSERIPLTIAHYEPQQALWLSFSRSSAQAPCS